MKVSLPRWMYIVFTAIAVFLILPLWPLVKDIIIQYNGHKAIATVTEVPLNCKRKFPNVIKVLLDGRSYRFDISLSECRAGKFAVGQQLEVLVHPSYNRIIRADDRADYMLALYLASLVFLFFLLWYCWKWLSKRVEKVPQ